MTNPSRYRNLSSDIQLAADVLDNLLQQANGLLQSDNMPEPWSQWEGAVEAVQCAMSEISPAGDFGQNVDIVCATLCNI